MPPMGNKHQSFRDLEIYYSLKLQVKVNRKEIITITMHLQMDILINGVLVDELSTIVHTSRLEYNARRLTEKLKEMIPRQMVQVRNEIGN